MQIVEAQMSNRATFGRAENRALSANQRFFRTVFALEGALGWSKKDF
jgi:hypothetical protein